MKQLFLIVITLFSLKIYSQKTVHFYVNKALENSPLLQKEKNTHEIIDLDLKQFKAIYKSPTVNLNANVLFAPIISNDNGTTKLEVVSNGATNYYGYDLGISNGGQYQTLVSINQPLFTKRYIEAYKNQATILKQKYANQITLTKLELKQTVTHQYILCIQSKKSIENAKENSQILENQIKEMKPLVAAGILKYIDLKWIELALKNSQIDQERFTANYQNNVNALNLLCGIQTTTIADLEDIELQISNRFSEKSIFAKQFQIDSFAIQSDQKITDLKYIPQVKAFGDAGLNATYLPKPNRLGFSVGMAVTWNLFDGHQQKLKHQQNQIKLENLKFDKAYFINQNTIRKDNLIKQIQSVDKQIILLNQQLKEYQKLLHLYQVEIKESLVSVLDLKIIIKEIALKKQKKTTIQLAKQILINVYNYWSN
ncbi:hypothetical protein KCTC32516_02025 [Polaribacter huanghezhanensis]|uniref:TolC family protein n=1 Tax=Polaribacter huanghezhanensis TaxID=1354726 RepID=UPI0026470362|nr:TolC family protein [Polaribacter huanghezhanensis]WKD86649.1 hypothetical protein KCTC32516_02025 [Polaribacter huanghezhanensis]